AIYEKSLPRHVAAGLGGKEYDGCIQIIRLAGALERNAIAKIFDPIFIIVENCILFGAKPSRRKAIHGDAVLAPVVREAHGQLPDATTASAIGAESCVTCDTGDGADVDDAAIAARDHDAGHGLRNKKTAAQIGIQNQVPIIPRNLESRLANVATRVVHENID